MRAIIILSLITIIFSMRGQDISTRNAIAAGEYAEYIPSVFPPSPSAFKFSTYGNIPLNGSTGGFSYSIPLYTIQDKDITLPISLDYSSSGVRIDELSTIVGTDWNLNAGGVISRVMRGYPDEKGQRWYPEYINPSTDEIKKKIYAIANGQSTTDVERDWFSFNVNSISGSFYLDENLNVIVNSKEYVKVTLKMGSGGAYGTVSSFTLIDKKGYTYVFGGSEDYLEGTIASSTSNVGPKDKYYSSWFLKEIISPNQNKISFMYQDNLMSYNTGTSFSLTYDQNCVCDGIESESYTSIYSPNVYSNNMKSRIISEIQFSTGSIVFNYNTQRLDNGGASLNDMIIKNGSDIIRKILFNYEMVYTNTVHPYEKLKTDNSLKYRLFLQDVTFANTDETLKEKYLFEYFEKARLPIRLSFSKDKYGYNNGSNNSTAFSSSLTKDSNIYSLLYYSNGTSYTTAYLEVNPSVVYYGMLKKIHYPTGGYTQINYEGNSNIEMGSRLEYTTQSAEIIKDCSTSSTDSETLTFISNGTPLYINAGGSLYEVPGCTDLSPDPLHDKYTLIVKNLTTGTSIISLNRKYEEPVNVDEFFEPTNGGNNYDGKSPINTTKDHKYEVTLKLLSKKFNTASGMLSIKYNAKEIPVEKTVYAGGARVKNIVDYNTDGKEYNKRTFYYNELSQYPSSKSTLNDILKPQYYNTVSYVKNCISLCEKSDPTYIYKRISIISSSYTSLYNNRKQGSYYTKITELIEKDGINNGAIERSFYNVNDDSLPNTITGPDIPGVPYSNSTDEYYGLLKKQNVYKREAGKYILANATEYKYLSSAIKTLSSYIIRKNYEGITDIPQAGEYGTDINNISISLYYNFINTPLISQVLDSAFLSGGIVVSETINGYGTSPYYNLKNQFISSSLGYSKLNSYQYAPDLLGQLSYMDKLVEANRVGIPIISEIKKKEVDATEKPISYTKTTYNEFEIKKGDGTTIKPILPEFVYSPTSTDKRASYSKYDEYGNIIYYIIDDATKVVCLWGYNGQYPIVKIENASYDQVKAALGGVTPESLSSAASPNTTLINGLRTNANLTESLITTYTYQPLVGVLTATDPREVTTHYEYDTFGRLKATYIQEKGSSIKKLLQSYDYHYQNQ